MEVPYRGRCHRPCPRGQATEQIRVPLAPIQVHPRSSPSASSAQRLHGVVRDTLSTHPRHVMRQLAMDENPRPSPEHTPEFSLWVESRSRGHGIGRDLTERLLGEAVSRGLAAVSLSVERENARAVRLYRSMGFVDVAGRGDDGVMVWTRPITGRSRSRNSGVTFPGGRREP